MTYTLAAITNLSFRFAKTMPHIPHEYTVRSPETEEAYVPLFNAIMADGVFEFYNGRTKRYRYPGDGRKYWAMTTALSQSRIINRMKIEDDLPRLRREGQNPSRGAFYDCRMADGAPRRLFWRERGPRAVHRSLALAAATVCHCVGSATGERHNVILPVAWTGTAREPRGRAGIAPAGIPAHFHGAGTPSLPAGLKQRR